MKKTSYNFLFDQAKHSKCLVPLKKLQRLPPSEFGNMHKFGLEVTAWVFSLFFLVILGFFS
jgi:hypothetical protein